MIFMRVITGVARGRRLSTLEGLDTRPTSQRNKEALFSVIQFDVEGRKVLDLFAGSGQLGIEALSRGASLAVFVDSSKKAAAVVKKNLEATGFLNKAQVHCREWKTYISSARENFNLVFLDPPYGKDILLDAIPLSAKALEKGGVIVCEHDASDKLPESFEGLELFQRKAYGRTVFSFYRKEQEIT